MFCWANHLAALGGLCAVTSRDFNRTKNDVAAYNQQSRQRNRAASHVIRVFKISKFTDWQTGFNFFYARFLNNFQGIADWHCKMISIEVKALPECLGFTPWYVSPVFVVQALWCYWRKCQYLEAWKRRLDRDVSLLVMLTQICLKK